MSKGIVSHTVSRDSSFWGYKIHAAIHWNSQEGASNRRTVFAALTSHAVH